MTVEQMSKPGLPEKPAHFAITSILILCVSFSVFFQIPLTAANAQDCKQSNKYSARLLPNVVGKVRPFRILDEPQILSGLKFKNEDGKTEAISNWKGRVVLLNLWATWCTPCREEMSALDRLQSELGGENFEVMPVSLDRGGTVKPKIFYQKNNIKALRLFIDSSTQIFKTLNKQGLAVGLPTTILIDKEGCAVGTFKGAAEWDSKDAKRLIRSIM